MPTQRPETIIPSPDLALIRPACPAPDDMHPATPTADGDQPTDTVSSDADDTQLAAGKITQSDSEAPVRDTPSPIGAEESPVDCDQRLTHTLSSPEPSQVSRFHSNSNIDFMRDPFGRIRYLPNTTSSFLKPGAKFVGTQKSEKQQYEVSVEIQHVDMEESSLCGYLRIQGLTDDHPTLTTYFEGEIIGPKYTFVTKHPEWGSSEKVDLQHWARFPSWKASHGTSKKPSNTQSPKDFSQRNDIFMRWKEYFLVPDHRVRNITGASFEGFYYICFNQISGKITGIYFHAKSEKYQELELKRVEDRGLMFGFEFR